MKPAVAGWGICVTLRVARMDGEGNHPLLKAALQEKHHGGDRL